MQVAIFCLIGYGRITTYCSSLSEVCKTYLRSWLGPAPSAYQLLFDGRVVPSTVPLPLALLNTSYKYSPDSVILQQPNSIVRPRRTSWVALDIDGEDLSEWIQSIRWVGVEEPSLISLITLWSIIHQRIVPFGTVINGIKNTAEEIRTPYVYVLPM